VDGLTLAYHPNNPDSFQDEYGEEANMCMATLMMLSLGVRVSNEFALGLMGETVVHRSDDILIFLPINDECHLSARYPSLTSVDDTLSQLRDAAKIIEEAEKKRANSR
jgi:predicted regulator of Ras-like GTPase activity (Roadblock/LC7/MglB family)